MCMQTVAIDMSTNRWRGDQAVDSVTSGSCDSVEQHVIRQTSVCPPAVTPV